MFCVGLFGGAAPWPLPVIAMRAITIQGNFVGTLAELSELLELVRTGGVAPIPMVHTTLEQASSTLDTLRRGQIEGRAVIMVPPAE